MYADSKIRDVSTDPIYTAYLPLALTQATTLECIQLCRW